MNIKILQLMREPIIILAIMFAGSYVSLDLNDSTPFIVAGALLAIRAIFGKVTFSIEALRRRRPTPRSG